MTTQDFFSACAHLDFPGLVLVFMLGWVFYIFWVIQNDETNNFDMKQMLCDNHGKPSAARFGSFISLVFSTWALMYHVIHTDGKVDSTLFIGYLGVWAGVGTAHKYLESRSSAESSTQSSADPLPPSQTNGN